MPLTDLQIVRKEQLYLRRYLYRKEKIKKIAVVADCEKAIAPCGACRQVMLELAEKNCPVILSNLKLSEIIQTTVGELLPYSFEG